jgi:hypothetical protein
MTHWQRLAEARIREWLQKPATERDAGGSPDGAVAPLEMQLLEDIIRLHETAAAAAEPAEADALRAQAASIETRLLIILEDSGRPLAAQHFGRLLQEIRSGSVAGRSQT